jgi:hypothetical protein
LALLRVDADASVLDPDAGVSAHLPELNPDEVVKHVANFRAARRP